MTATSPTLTSHSVPNQLRAGLALSAIVGAANLPFLLPGVDWGESDPGQPLILLGAALGMVSVVCAILAWNSGSRRLIRINAAALIINGLMIVPALFVDTTAFIRLASAIMIVGTIVAVVLMMRRQRSTARVVD